MIDCGKNSCCKELLLYGCDRVSRSPPKTHGRSGGGTTPAMQAAAAAAGDGGVTSSAQRGSEQGDGTEAQYD